MTSVTIYTKPSCFKCDRTKQFLTIQGVTYNEVDVTTSDAPSITSPTTSATPKPRSSSSTMNPRTTGPASAPT